MLAAGVFGLAVLVIMIGLLRAGRVRLLTGLLLVAAGALAALLLLEGGARLWLTYLADERARILYLYDAATIADKTTLLTGLPYLNYGPNPAWEEVNARGVRGPLVALPKPAGVYRIVALGGSTTFGHALSAAEAWPAQLERSLRDDYGYAQVEVVNLGSPGYYSLDSVVNLATRGLAHDPDLVLVYHGVNDAIIRMYTDTACYQGDTPLFGMGLDRGIWQYVTEPLPPSALYRLAAYALGRLEDPASLNHRLRHTGFCPPEPKGISPVDLLAQHPPVYFERNMRSLIGLARAAGAEVVLSTFAWDTAGAQAALAANPDLHHNRALLQAIDEQNALLRRIAAETGAGLADFGAPGVTRPGDFQGDQVHQTAAGAQHQGAFYAAYLHDQGLIK
jgi:lysophospholipase L1-like esterase